MTLNPRDYDVGELRTRAETSECSSNFEKRHVSDSEKRRVPASDRDRDETVARSLTISETIQHQRDDSVEDRSRPYLETVPHGPNAEHEIGEWLAYLIEVGGHERARDALAYYREIGWISEDAETALAARLPGLDPPTHDRVFTAADHRTSFRSVVRLQSARRFQE